MSGTEAAPEGITNPPIDDLLAIADSKYALVIYSAKRARQINAYYSQLGEGLLEYVGPLVETHVHEKPLSIALREINEGLRAVAVLNGADPQGGDNEAALQMIGDIEGIEVLPTSIVRRKAFPNAAAEGRAVVEQSPRDAKAIDELAALVSAVFV